MRAMEGLTPRQREVLALVAKGHTNGEIAEMLGISSDGVKWHVGEILARLDVRSREEAAEWWRREGRTGARARRWIGGLRFVPLAGAGLAGVAIVAATLVIVALQAGGGHSEKVAAAAAATTPATVPSPTPTLAVFLPDGPLPFRVCSEIDGYRKLTAMEMTDVFHNRRFGDGIRPDPIYWPLFLSDFYWMPEPHAVSANVEVVAFSKGTWTGTAPPSPDSCGSGGRQGETFQALSMYDHRVLAMEVRNGILKVTVTEARNSFERIEYPEPSLPRGPIDKSGTPLVNGLRVVNGSGQVLATRGPGPGNWEFRDDGSFVSGFIGAGAPNPQQLELTRAADIELFCTRVANAVTFREAKGETKVAWYGACGDAWTPAAEIHLDAGSWAVSVDGDGFYTLLAKGSPRPCRC